MPIDTSETRTGQLTLTLWQMVLLVLSADVLGALLWLAFPLRY